MAAAADEYPCMRRLRHRRLLAYLQKQGLEAAFHTRKEMSLILVSFFPAASCC
jgi:hypothetical protein